MTADRFDAFISYARSSSTSLASALQTALEKFAKPWNRLRAIRVFRDDSSMSANSALWSTIEGGLREANSFILLLTPEAAASPYVNKEIAWWVHNKGTQRLLLVHVAGTIGWDPAVADFSAGSTAIPPALRGGYREEPRWADLSWFGQPESLGISDPRFTERVADLSAAVRGIARDSLIGENIRQHRKTVRLTRAAVLGLSVLLVLSLVAGGFAFVQRGEALRQRDTATKQSLIARTGQLAVVASGLTRTDLQQAALLSATAYRSNPDQRTERALHDSITSTPQLVEFIDFGTEITAVGTARDATTVVVGTDSGDVVRVDRTTRDRETLMNLGGPVGFLRVSDDSRTVAASSVDTSGIWRDGVLTELPQTALISMSPSGRTVLVRPDLPATAEPYLEVRSGERRVKVHTEMHVGGNYWTALPDDHTVIVVSMAGGFMKASAQTGVIETQGRGLVRAWNLGLGSISADGKRFGYVTDMSNTVAWEFDNPPETVEDPVLRTDIAGFAPRDIALNHNGTEVAVARDGVIYVGNLRPEQEPGRVVPLLGAGPSPNGLGFASETLLFSASGSAVALWDLSRMVPLATGGPFEISKTCNACGPPKVAVSPSGNKVLVVSSSSATFVDLLDRRSVLYMHSGYALDPRAGDSEVERVLGSEPVALWLDEDRLFAYSSREGQALILGGGSAGEVLHRFSLPQTNGRASQAALRADGKVAVATGEAVLLVDPESGGYEMFDHSVTALSSNGAYGITTNWDYASGQTHVEVVDVGVDEVVAAVSIEGQALDFIADGPAGISVLREILPGGRIGGDTEVLRVDLADSSVQPVGRLGQRIASGSQLVGMDDQQYVEKNGLIVRYDLADASVLDILPVTSAVKAWNGVGLTPDGRTMVVASEPGQQVMRLPVSAEAWLEIACTLAGRPATDDDLRAVVESVDGLAPACT